MFPIQSPSRVRVSPDQDWALLVYSLARRTCTTQLLCRSSTPCACRAALVRIEGRSLDQTKSLVIKVYTAHETLHRPELPQHGRPKERLKLGLYLAPPFHETTARTYPPALHSCWHSSIRRLLEALRCGHARSQPRASVASRCTVAR